MTLTRKIVRIDEEKCDGCGLCIPSCAEGALKIINGKAKLVADKLCDGLGACLGHCPRGAIIIEERPADAFDESAVHAHLESRPAAAPCPSLAPLAHHHHDHDHGGCPGSRLRVLMPQAPLSPAPADSGPRTSQLRQWPVQLSLLPVSGRVWQDADVLIAADCVPFACAEFHERLLAGKTLAIACPKLDDVSFYVAKLNQIFASNSIRSITIAHMQVPCCSGIVRAVQMALMQAGREDIPVTDITIGIDGSILP